MVVNRKKTVCSIMTVVVMVMVMATVTVLARVLGVVMVRAVTYMETPVQGQETATVVQRAMVTVRKVAIVTV